MQVAPVSMLCAMTSFSTCAESYTHRYAFSCHAGATVFQRVVVVADWTFGPCSDLSSSQAPRELCARILEHHTMTNRAGSQGCGISL